MDRRTVFCAAICLLLLPTMIPYAPAQPLSSTWVALTRSGAEPPESYAYSAWNAETGEFLFAQAHGECSVGEGDRAIHGIGWGADLDGSSEAALEAVKRQRDEFLSGACRENGLFNAGRVTASAQNFPQFRGSIEDGMRPLSELPPPGFKEYPVAVTSQSVHLRIASGVGYPEDCRVYFGMQGLSPERFGAWGAVWLTGLDKPKTTRGDLLCVHIEFEDVLDGAPASVETSLISRPFHAVS